MYSAASPSPRAGSTTNLKITKDAEGNITNNEVTSGYTLSAPQTTDLSSLYTLKFTDPKTEDGTEVYNLIVYIEFDSDDTKYAPFTFTCDKLSTQGYAPPVYFNGEFKDKDPGAKINGVYTDYHYVPICGSEEGLTIRKNTDVVMHVYGNDYITIEKCNSRNVYTNLLFTVTDDNGDNQASFRYYNGRVYDKQGNYDDYVKNLAVTYGNASGNYSENKINQHVAFTLTVPEDGLKINMKVVDTYVPVVVNQYVISDDGTRRLATADDGFTAAITKKSNSSGTDAYKYKFFTQSYAEDYYSKLADNTAFCDSFTVTGGTEKHNMLMESSYTGGYVSASPVEGYMVASIDARTTNCDGVEQTDFNVNYYNSAYAYKAGTDYSNKLITASFFGNVQRSQQLVINIYYAKKTTVTFKQVVADSQVNTSSGTELAWAELSNPNTLDDGLTAFIETDESGMFNSGNPLRQLDGMTGYYSRAMIIRGSNKTSADTSVDPYEYTWLSKYYTNPSTPDPEDPSNPDEALVTLTQFARANNNAYQSTTDGTATMRVTDGTSFMLSGDETAASLTVPNEPETGVSEPSVTGRTYIGKKVKVSVQAPENYYVSKVEAVSSGGANTVSSDSNGDYIVNINSGIVNINVYYAMPQITFSTNNTAQTGKGTVFIDGEEIISEHEYMDKALVKQGETKTLLIRPNKYTDSHGEEKNYSVAYILMGTSRNNMKLIDSNAISTNETTGEITVTLANISSDYDLHIQFAGEEEIKTAMLIVSHHIKLTGEYQDCDADNHGTVVTTGTLSGVDKPLRDSTEAEVENLTLTEDASISGFAVKGTQLSFAVTPPKHYIYFNNSDIATGERIEESELDDISDYQAERYYNELFTIEAPATDNSGSKFLYWKATDVVDGEKVEGTEKAVCYTAYYSYRVTKDLFIEPVYEDGENNWDITLSNAIYSREQFTDSEGANKQDNVYSDLLISVLTPDQSLIKDKDVQFGIVLEKADDGNYPGKNTEAIEMLFADKLPESGKVTSAVRNDNTYYIYDKTDLAASMTNMNRIDYYIRFANTERLRGYKFNAYVYLIVDGTVIVSRDVSELCIDECGTRVYE